MPVLTLTNLLEKFINERGSAAVMKEWKGLIKEEVTKVANENGDLRRENERLTNENASLRSKLATAIKSDEWEEHEGAAFKRKPDGTFHSGIYCPIHHAPASSIDSGFPYSCPINGCGWASHITPGTLKQTLLKITPGTLSNQIFDS